MNFNASLRLVVGVLIVIVVVSTIFILIWSGAFGGAQ